MRRVLRSTNVLTPEGPRPATVHVDGESISGISSHGDVAADEQLHDYGDLWLLPGTVDAHVHVNEPGRTEWEGFATATLAAAAGGTTTIVDMPLNSIPPTTSVASLRLKADALPGQCHVDVALWGGAVPGNAAQLRPMLEAGAAGFKCFLVESGVPEFGHLDAGGAREALRELRGTSAPLLFHAELPGPIEAARPRPGDDPRSYARYLRSRPGSAEEEAIDLVCRLARETGSWAHIVHLSAASALPILRRAREEGVEVTAETTPHYLYFAAERIPDGAPQYKCAPPIREEENREALWQALQEGLIESVVSDHSPCTPELKRLQDGDVEHAWGGIASLQIALPAVWTEASRRAIGLPVVSRLMSEAPSRTAGLSSRKGRLARGLDADVIAFDPEAELTVTPEMLRHRHPVTPYHGERLRGVVRATWVRGSKVWENGTSTSAPGGRWVQRPGSGTKP